MITVPIQLPENIFSALRKNPDEFVQEMRIAAAVKWDASHFCRNNLFLWGGHLARPVPVAGETPAPQNVFLHNWDAPVKWYELGEISQSKAAEIAGITRSDFINTLSRYRADFMQYTAEELAKEMTNVD